MKYIGTKILNDAKLMNKLQYNERRGWQMPLDEDPNEQGYMVFYPDGYVSWSPKDVFEEAYRPMKGLTFGMAIEVSKIGHKVAREGWNGKGMFVVYQKGYPDGIPCNKNTAEAWRMQEGDLFKCEPYLQIKMVNGSHSMWVPSINDVLAEDWTIVEL